MRCTGLIALVASLLLLGCGRPETLVWVRAPALPREQLQQVQWRVDGLDRLEAVPRYDQAIQGLFGNKSRFEEAFLRDLVAELPKPPADSVAFPRLQLSLDRMFIYEQAVSGGDTEGLPILYCVVEVEFRVLDEHGKLLVDGIAKDRTCLDSWWHRPDEARLRNALILIRRSLTTYLSGSMDSRRVSGIDEFPSWGRLPVLRN